MLLLSTDDFTQSQDRRFLKHTRTNKCFLTIVVRCLFVGFVKLILVINSVAIPLSLVSRDILGEIRSFDGFGEAFSRIVKRFFRRLPL